MWEERWSQSRSRSYYYNRTTGESVWERPSELPVPESTTTLQVHCHHILIKHEGSRRPSSWRCPNISMTQSEALAKSRALINQIHSLQDFVTLARKESDCSSAREGGDLGWFGRGKMQPAFEQAAFALQPGQMTREPVITDSGVHLIWRVA